MRESFYEESAVSANGRAEAKFYTAFHVVSIILLIPVFFQVFFSYAYIIEQVHNFQEGLITSLGLTVFIAGWIMILLLFIALFLFFFLWKRRFNVSYDYIFVGDELRVSKVFNGKRRKFLKKFDADHILQIGWVESEAFGRASSGYAKRDIVLLSPNKTPQEGKEFYYILYTAPYEKKIYIFEARKEFLECLVPAVGMTKLVRK